MADIPLNIVIYMAFKPLIKIYLSAALGFVSVKVGILTTEGASVISQMILTFFLPCLVFANIVGSIQIGDLKYLGILVLTGALYLSLGAVWAGIIRLTTPVPKAWIGGMAVASILNNSGDLPIAYVTTLGNSKYFPPDSTTVGTAYCVLYTIGFNLFLFNLGGGRILTIDADVQIPNKFEPTVPPFSLEKIWQLIKRKSGMKDSELSPKTSRALQHEITKTSHEAPVGLYSSDNISFVSGLSNNGLQGSGSIDDVRASENVLTTRRIRSRSIGQDSVYTARQTIKGALEEKESAVKVPFYKVPGRKFKRGWHTLKAKNKFTKFMCNFFENLFRIQALSVMVSLLVAFVPWLRRLFVEDPKHPVSGIPNAPDDKPPLDFLMDFVKFMGQCQVQLGLFMLGGTIARLKIKSLPKGFWKTLLSLGLFKLVLLPIFAVFWTSRVKKMEWFTSDMPMFPVVMTAASGTPSATSQIYLTLLYTLDPEDAAQQLNCFGATLIANYAFLPITMTILMSYTVKNLL